MTAADAAAVITAFERIDHSDKVLADIRDRVRKQLRTHPVPARLMTPATRERLVRMGYGVRLRGRWRLTRWWLDVENPYWEVSW